jgi:hypothetical protein
MFERFGRAEKLLMRIRSFKWQGTTILSSQDGITREELAGLVAELQALELTARGATTDDALGAIEQRVEALGQRLSNLGQQ